MQTIEQHHLDRAAVFKALGHPARQLLLEALAHGERCVCELTGLAGLDISTVSKHLALLRSVGVVAARRQGQSVYYRLELACVPNFIACVDAHIREAALSRIGGPKQREVA
jgi:ArsR family transcriptional regulator